MPQLATSKSVRHRGWHFDQRNGRMSAVYDQTEVFDFDGNDLAVAQATTFATTTTQTAGSYTLSAAAAAFTAPLGNVSLGNPGAFATTQPQGAVVMGGSSLSGIAPVGAIATAGAIFASDTVVMKIVAGGTANNVET